MALACEIKYCILKNVLQISLLCENAFVLIIAYRFFTYFICNVACISHATISKAL